MYTDPCLNRFLDVLRVAAFVLCIVFNGMLLRMIFMGHRNDLGTYRFMILAFVSTDIVYGIVHFLVMPVPEIYENAFVMGGHGTWTSRYGVGCVWPMVLSLAFPMLSFNFAYRLVSVKFLFHLHWFKDPRVIGVLFAITAANSLTWAGISRYTGFDDDESMRYVHALFEPNASHSAFMYHYISNINDYVVVDRGLMGGFQSLTGLLDGIHWVNCFGTATMGLLGSIAYSFMAFASWNIVQHLHKNAQMSERFHKQHVQLFWALVLQAITPFITSYFPLGLCGMLPFLGTLSYIVVGIGITGFTIRSTLIGWIRCHGERKTSKVKIFVDPEQRLADGVAMRRFTIF